jgi:hypothetical protein
MSRVPDDKLLTALTIPGTHDTVTYENWNINVMSKCQDDDLNTQLDNGIRFVDIRLYVGDIEGQPGLWCCHASVDLGMPFFAVLEICDRFLAAHPSETIVMSVKDDRDGYDEFERLVGLTLQPYVDKGRVSKNTLIPRIGDVRGKIVLLRRFQHYEGVAPEPGGIDASGELWPQNSTESHTNFWGLKLHIQDEYKIYTPLNVWRKFDDYMQPLLDTALHDADMQKLYINFASGTGLSTPREVAETVNPKLLDYMLGNPKGRFGILPMDFPDYDLIRAIIDTNM